jgi:hypothetical protein
MSQKATTQFGSGSAEERITMLYLTAPSTTTDADVVIDVGATAYDEIVGGCTTFTGVDQTTPLGTATTEVDDFVTSSTMDITSETDDMVVDAISFYNPGGDTVTVGANQTERVNYESTSIDCLYMSTEAGATTTTMSWSFGSDFYTGQIGVNINAKSDQSITPGLASQTVTAYNPTVTPGAAYVTPGLVSQPVTAHNPTVVPGVAYITPALADQTTVAYDPIAVIQQQFIEPGLVSQPVTAFSPTVTPGVAYIDPGLVTQSVTAFDPTVLAGEVFITADLATSNIAAYDPTVTPGVAYITPGLVSQTVTAYDPYVYQDQFVEPGVADQTVTAHDPTVLRGAVYLEPNFVQQLTVAYNPTVTPGTAYITPDPATSTVTAFDPTLYLEQLVEASLVTQTVQGFAPLVLSTAQPVATVAAGGWDTGPTPGQNLHDYTSDSSDATWIEDTPA